jgi:hypothetical protein
VPPRQFGAESSPWFSGLVPVEWREVGLREITERTFILNLPGAKKALDAELSTCSMRSAWRFLWALFEDYGLKPDDLNVGCDGLARRVCARAVVRLPNRRSLQRWCGS